MAPKNPPLKTRSKKALSAPIFESYNNQPLFQPFVYVVIIIYYTHNMYYKVYNPLVYFSHHPHHHHHQKKKKQLSLSLFLSLSLYHKTHLNLQHMTQHLFPHVSIFPHCFHFILITKNTPSPSSLSLSILAYHIFSFFWLNTYTVSLSLSYSFVFPEIWRVKGLKL